MSSTPAPIVLLTDFGLADWYVAELKGVLLVLAPGAALVDFSHEVPPGDVVRAAFLLARGHGAFPAGAVFVVVVDPGVGTERRPLAVAAAGRFYVAPDNGVLEAALAVPGVRVRRIDDPHLLAVASRTFHGRDVFAPVAARLALRGEAAFADVGSLVKDAVRLVGAIGGAGAGTGAGTEPGAGAGAGAWATARTDRLMARVLHVDRFGNAITDLTEAQLRVWLAGRESEGVIVTVRGVREAVIRGLALTYGASPEPVAVVGSSGLVEIALPGGHAGLALGLGPGTRIELHYEDPFPGDA